MSEATPTYACPWCPHTDTHLKKVLNHLESAHHQHWCDLALYPPTAGDEPKRKGGGEELTAIIVQRPEQSALAG